MELTARLIVILFGLWLICVSVMILTRPRLMLKALGHMASTPLINYSELGLRLIVGLGVARLAQHTPYPRAVMLAGLFLIITAILLMLIPRRWHHNYAVWWASRLSPTAIRLAAPFSAILGGILIGLAT